MDTSEGLEDKPNDAFGRNQLKGKLKNECCVTYIGISPDEKYLLYSNTVEQFIQVHDLKTGNFLYTTKEEGMKRKFFINNYQPIKTNLITKKNMLLYRDIEKGSNLQMFDLNAGKPVSIEGHLWEHYSLEIISMHEFERYIALATVGSIVVNGVTNKQWKILDVEQKKMVCFAEHAALYHGSSGVEALKMFGKDLLLVATSSSGSTICLSYCGVVGRAEPSAIPFFHFYGHSKLVLQMVFSSDEKRLYSACRDNTIKFWDLGSIVDDLRQTLKTTHPSQLREILTNKFEMEEHEKISANSVVIHR